MSRTQGRPEAGGEKVLATNPNATSKYQIEQVVEAGMVLTGTEAKSLRGQAPNIRDGFVEVTSRGGKVEAWLLNCHIGPYSHGNIWNHEALRRRKLLLHAHQIAQLYGSVTQKGLSIIPLRMYYKKGVAKVELGIGRGKKKFDKRQDLKKRSADREIDIALKKGR
jgi:SsrA-binding protein